MRVWAGTSGYSYKEWKGVFYPEDLPAAGMLEYYASRLPAVEINHSFYRMPRASVLEGWAASVPDGFRFVLKAPRRITHFKRLRDVEEETEYLVRTAASLGDRAGVILYQLPPNFKEDLERLDRFLDHLPNPGRSAFEFRHPSWFGEELYSLLRRRRAALCIAETDEAVEPPLVSTAGWGYLRLRKSEYGPAELKGWAERLREQEWDDVYVFFKHERAGPDLAARLLELGADA